MASEYDGSVGGKLAAARRLAAAREAARLATAWQPGDAAAGGAGTAAAASSGYEADARAAAMAAAMAETLAARRRGDTTGTSGTTTRPGSSAVASSSDGGGGDGGSDAKRDRRKGPKTPLDAGQEASRRLTAEPALSAREQRIAGVVRLLLESKSMQSLWVNMLLLVHGVVAAGVIYQLVSHVSTPFAEGADHFAPLRGIMPPGELTLLLGMIVLSTALLAAGAWFSSRGWLVAAALPGAVPVAGWWAQCATHTGLWAAWQFWWLPAVIPLLAGAQVVVNAMFDSYHRDLLRVRELLMAEDAAAGAAGSSPPAGADAAAGKKRA